MVNQRIRGVFYILVIVLLYVLAAYHIGCKFYGWCKYTTDPGRYIRTDGLRHWLHHTNSNGQVTAPMPKNAPVTVENPAQYVAQQERLHLPAPGANNLTAFCIEKAATDPMDLIMTPLWK